MNITTINFSNVCAFTQAEKRLTLRLIRYWVFLIVAYILSIGICLYFSAVHTAGSSISASIGFIGPRYRIASIGFLYLVVFIVGIAFLAFDVRARDARERMLEVLDSRPYSNLELVLGRFLGLFLLAWVPIILLVLIIQGLGLLLLMLGSPIGRTIEPLSLIGFPFFIAIPAISFSCALVILITLVVPHRFIALLLSIAAIVSLYSLSAHLMPYAVSSSIDLLGFFQIDMPSDWVPGIAADFSGWMQRIGLLVLSLGVLLFAAVVHPRLDDASGSMQTGAALAFTVVGLLLIGSVYILRIQEIQRMNVWRESHQEKRDNVLPDIVAMRGVVSIKPGQTLALDLDLEFRAPQDSSLKEALFSLNPGFGIHHVNDANGQALEYSFEDGLLALKLASPLAAGATQSVRLEFAGKPDTLFAYLDSAINYRNLASDEANVELLGVKNAIFDQRYVALMPSIYWLPGSGVDVGRDDIRERPRDFSALNLEVKVPENWLVAGPGLRRELARSGGEVTYAFAPKVMIAEVALMAAPFKSYRAEIDNIVFELLLHPDHTNNIDVLAEGSEQVQAWIASRLSLLRDIGLEYPFGAFSLVEVPNSLRGYGGGWRMDTALAPPSMVLMKESSLPTARFDSDIVESIDGARAQRDGEDGVAKIVRNRLFDLFNNDFTGGNVFAGFAKSFFTHQSSAMGSDAIALEYALNQLTTLVISGQRSYFSVARIADLNQTLLTIVSSSQPPGISISDRVINAISADEEVWEIALTSPLNNIDPWENPGLTGDLLTLKGGGVARVLYDLLGPEKTGRLLANLLDSHRGGSAYTRDDVIAAASAVDGSLATVLDDWFTSTGLAGFTSEDIQLYQLPNTGNGDARFQLRLRINNDEAVTGFTRVAWNNEPGGARTRSEIIRVPGRSGVEYGVVLSKAPVEVFIEPYLSLNREDFLLRRFVAGEIANEAFEAFEGVRELAGANRDNGRIVVDDLDSGFKIVTHMVDQVRHLPGQNHGVSDRGLPLATRREFPEQWSRLKERSAWGKYRKTYAFIRSGDGASRVSFNARIPRFGRWTLELHLPELWFGSGSKLGRYELEIVTENSRIPIDYDARQGLAGWNPVGEYDLPQGDVRVEFSNKTSGSGVIADAVAWSPVN